MGAMQLDKSKTWEDCGNRCVGANGIKRTRKRMWLLGWPISLCPQCAETMTEAYDDALKRIKEESVS
jgi:hypothetical protein